MMSRYTGHERRAKVDIKAAVITVSTSRYRARGRGEEVRDDSGDIAESLLKAHGFEVVARELVPDDRGHIRGAVERCRSRANLLILIGGTGVSPTDVTVEAIRPILDKELTLFPALFAYLSYADVGTACLPSRVLAGVTGRCLVFCLPGSPGAVKLALEKIILPEVGHLINMVYGV